MKPNQVVAAIAAILNSVDWQKLSAILQSIIDASNQGRLGPWLTNALLKQEWNSGRFVVRDHYKVNVSKSAKVKISYLGDSFRDWFLNGTEGLERVHELTNFTLDKDTYDKGVIDQIGGVEKSISSLQDVLAKMQAQPKGPESDGGPLLTNGHANIFYVPQLVTKLTDNSFSYINEAREVIEEIKDPRYLFELSGQRFVLRVVRVYWNDDGWDVRACTVERSSRWRCGYQVFFRKVLESLELSAPAYT